MMKSIYKVDYWSTIFMVILLSVSALIGCQKDMDDDSLATPTSENEYTLQATLPTHTQSRVSLVDNESTAIEVTWENNAENIDRISVYNSTDGEFVGCFSYIGTDGSSEGEFKADILSLMEEGGSYVALFPYVEGDESLTLSECEHSALAITTQTQSGDLTHLRSSIKMRADFNYTQEGTVIDFEHQSSIIKIVFELESGVTPKMVTALSGPCEATFIADIESSTIDNKYTLYVSMTIEQDSGESDDFAIYVYDSNSDTRYYSTAISETLVAGNCYIANIPSLSMVDVASGIIPIYSQGTLSKIGQDSDYRLSGDYMLVRDITLSSSWSRLGASKTTPFTGTFDGQGYSISGLTIDDTSDYQGLFGYISGATISNLIISEPSITTTVDYVGAIVGYSLNSTIKKCGVVGGSVSGEDNVGGIVGACRSYNSSATAYTYIESCYNSSSVKGSSYVGGVVGNASADSAYATSSYSYIRGCYNIGAVDYSTSIAGGVVGYASYSKLMSSTYAAVSIYSCYNTAPIYGSDPDPSFVGGVVGSLSTSSTTSYLNVSTCYYIDQVDDDADSGIGYGKGTTTLCNTVLDLNNALSSNTYFTEGNPSSTHLPYVIDENLECPTYVIP